MVSGGLIAFIPYLAIFATLAWRGLTYWRQGGDRRLVAALWATLLGYTEINMTLDSLNGHYHNVLLFLICGAILGRLEETGGRGQESGGRSQEAGVRGQESGGRRQEAG
jgi:O-antigen ligase